MAIYQVRVVQDGRTTARKQLSSGLANGEAAVIKAQAGATYVIQNSLAGADEKGAPAKIVAKRVGQNLHIAIEQEEKSFFDFLRGKKTKANPDVPDLVIEAYFDHPPASVVGALEGGGYAAYDLTAITPAGLNVPPAGEGASHGQAGFASYSGPVISDLPQQDWIGGLSGLQVTGIGLAGLAGLALVVAADQGDGNPAAPTPDPVIAAQDTIKAYATDPKNTPPTLANYTTLGVTGVTSTNLAAINSAIDALDASKVDSKAKVQTVVDAYVKILAEANGSAADLTPGTNPATEDYATIGVTLGFSANKVYETNELSLLNDVIGSLSTTAVDTVAEINAIAAVVVKVMTLAAGPTANMPALTTPLTVSDLVLIGLPNSGAGAVSDSNIAAIQSALSALSDNGGQLKVDTFGELKALVVAVASIVNYANDSTQAIPTYSNYADMGVTGVTATNVGAINSAVDAHTGSMADTKAKIQSIVDDYLAIIAEANGTAADATPTSDPTPAQYAGIGADIGFAAGNAQALSLLNDSLGGLNFSNVDTIAKINALAAAANAVMSGAAGGTAPTLDQLNLLGLDPGAGLSSDNLVAVQEAIGNTADSGLQVDTMAELYSVVSHAVSAVISALNVITNFANDNTQTAPILSNYIDLAVKGVDASNLSAMNSAVDALSRTQVDTLTKVQTMVTAYAKILAEANGAAADDTPDSNPTANDFHAIGANVGQAGVGIHGGADLASSALALLDDAIAGLSTSAVDTVSEINDLGSAVDDVMNLAKLATGSAIPATTLTVADLTLLGVNTGLVNTAAELMAIQTAIIGTADSGSGVSTILALQAIVDANAH